MATSPRRCGVAFTTERALQLVDLEIVVIGVVLVHPDPRDRSDGTLWDGLHTALRGRARSTARAAEVPAVSATPAESPVVSESTTPAEPSVTEPDEAAAVEPDEPAVPAPAARPVRPSPSPRTRNGADRTHGNGHPRAIGHPPGNGHSPGNGHPRGNGDPPDNGCAHGNGRAHAPGDSPGRTDGKPSTKQEVS